MKNLLISLFLFPLLAFGQDSATYTFRLDTFGIDSFFLVEVYTQPQAGLPRAIETEYPIYMTDTAQLSAYIVSMRAEYDAITAQATELAKRKSAWDYRYNRVVCLRDSVFYGASCTSVGSRMVKAPPHGADMPDNEPSGFWVTYNTGGFDWISGIEQAKADGTILYRNGTTAKFTRPKAKQPKKTTVKPKQKKQ